MMRLRSVVSAGLVLMVVLVGVVSSVSAQAGLSDEQLALLDRVAEARAKYQAYTSLTRTTTGSETQDITITLGDLTQVQSSVYQWDSTATYVMAEGEPDNVSMTVTGSSEITQGETTTAYTITAEVRLVDGVTYVNAAYETPDPTLPEIPQGWIVVEDPDAYPVFASLQLDSVPLHDEEEELFDDIELVKTTATDVQIEAVTLDDGTSADRITVVLGQEGLVAAFGTQEDADPTALALLSVADDASGATLSVTMDAENNPLELTMTLLMQAVGVDANTLSPGQFPEGVLLDFAFSTTQTQTLSDFNALFEPVGVPEELAE
jgi:hypothetical protein